MQKIGKVIIQFLLCLLIDISELLCKQSVLAELDNEKIWDMHRPLEESCTLKFLHFKDPDPTHVNNVIIEIIEMS
jgi:hypothetical protein